MKANYQQRNRPSRLIQGKRSQLVTQKMAWVNDRPLLVHGHRFLLNMNFGNNHRTVHRHIFFNQNKTLPNPVNQSNNIGFGGNGLFNDNVNQQFYNRPQQISNSNQEDNLLEVAINQNANPGNYNLLNNNCQVWVRNVVNSYNQLRQRGNLPQVNYQP